MLDVGESLLTVVRRFGADRTHVAQMRYFRQMEFIKPYMAPAAPLNAVCGVRIRETDVVMATGTKVSCKACQRYTDITEQSPRIHEILKVSLP